MPLERIYCRGQTVGANYVYRLVRGPLLVKTSRLVVSGFCQYTCQFVKGEW